MVKTVYDRIYKTKHNTLLTFYPPEFLLQPAVYEGANDDRKNDATQCDHHLFLLWVMREARVEK